MIDKHEAKEIVLAVSETATELRRAANLTEEQISTPDLEEIVWKTVFAYVMAASIQGPPSGYGSEVSEIIRDIPNTLTARQVAMREVNKAILNKNKNQRHN